MQSYRTRVSSVRMASKYRLTVTLGEKTSPFSRAYTTRTSTTTSTETVTAQVMSGPAADAAQAARNILPGIPEGHRPGRRPRRGVLIVDKLRPAVHTELVLLGVELAAIGDNT